MSDNFCSFLSPGNMFYLLPLSFSNIQIPHEHRQECRAEEQSQSQAVSCRCLYVSSDKQCNSMHMYQLACILLGLIALPFSQILLSKILVKFSGIKSSEFWRLDQYYVPLHDPTVSCAKQANKRANKPVKQPTSSWLKENTMSVPLATCWGSGQPLYSSQISGFL